MRKILILTLALSWLLAGWPVIWYSPRIPPPINEARAAAPTFVAAGALATGTAAITVGLPVGIATNDILLLFLETSNQAITIANPNGGTWTEVTNSPQGTGTAATTTAVRLTVFWSRYNGTQTDPVTSDSGNRQLARTIAVRGVVNSGNPWDITSGGVDAVANTSGVIPGATTTVADTFIVTAIGTALPDAGSTVNFSSWSNGSFTATEQIDNTSTSGVGGGLGIATGPKAAIGAYGNTTVTLVNSSVKAMMSIALKPQLSTTTLGNGASEPSSVTIAPEAGATDLDNFTLVTSSGTDTVTAATVTLASDVNAYNNIAQVDITDDANTAKCTAVSGLTSNTVTFATCNISVTTSSTNYKIRITPKTHANMPAVPGASYATTGTVTAFTSTNGQTVSDTGSATVTVDNASPANVTAASGTAGIEEVALSWTNPADGDFSQSLVLRRAGTAVGDTPVEGTTYIVGNTIGSSTVACVVATPTAGCTDSNLTGGTAYHYKIFAKDSNGNYSQTGVVPTGSPFTPTAKVISVAVSDGIITYGTMSTGEIKTTVTLVDTQTLTNDGNVTETFNIKGQNTACPWTLMPTAGSEQYVHQFCKTTDVSCSSPPTNYTELTTGYTTLYTGVTVSGTRQIDLRFIAPTATTCSGQQNVDVIIQATQ